MLCQVNLSADNCILLLFLHESDVLKALTAPAMKSHFTLFAIWRLFEFIKKNSLPLYMELVVIDIYIKTL